MGKEIGIFVVSLVALIVSGYAIYSVNNSGGQASTTEIIDYSAEFALIQSSLDQLSAKLEEFEVGTINEFETMKTEFEEVIETANSKTTALLGIKPNGQTIVESNTVSESIVQTSGPDQTSPVTPVGLTINLNKEIYNPGEIVTVSGSGQASQPVSLKVKDPDGLISSAHSSSSTDGTITMVYILPSDADDGNWQLTIKIDDSEETITFKVA